MLPRAAVLLHELLALHAQQSMSRPSAAWQHEQQSMSRPKVVCSRLVCLRCGTLTPSLEQLQARYAWEFVGERGGVVCWKGVEIK